MRTSILIVGALVALFYISTYPKDEAIFLSIYAVGMGIALCTYYVIGSIIMGVFKWARKQ